MGKDTDANPVETRAGERAAIGRVAVAVDPHSEGQDAAVLGSAIAGAIEAETMLLTVEPDLRLILPGLDSKQMRRDTEAMLVKTRQSVAPEARMRIDTDLSTARGLKRLAARERCDVLAVGSSRHGPDGQVTIGRLTRQLFNELGCAVAIAPRRLSRRPELVLTKIGVAFDDGPESRAALGTAVAIAVGCGAELVVRGVVDDRIPSIGWRRLWLGDFEDSWPEVIDAEVETMLKKIESATRGIDADVSIELRRGRPASSLLEFSQEVDLLVIGSRRWGPLARVLLGGTGEALVHGARCSLLVVPRPRAGD
jgi:nucleotide-binding universal stress UspA family protein